MTEQPLVEVDNLQKYFYEQDTIVDRLLRNEPVAVKAVDGVSFDIYEGETLGLVGESGCGKSTCGETLLRLQEATDGSVTFDGTEVFELSGGDLKEFRRNAQFIFQDPFSSLDPRMPIGESIREPLRIQNWPESDPDVTTAASVEASGISADRVTVTVGDDIDKVVEPRQGVAEVTVHIAAERDEPTAASDPGVDTAGAFRVRVADGLSVEASEADDELDVAVSVGRSDAELRQARAADLLDRVGLSADQVDRFPHEFSGGQRQRIGIARALALNPDFLVLDEPTSALDVSVQAQILNLLGDLQAEFDLTFLLISHDLSVIRHISDRVAVMYLGEIVEIGPAEAIFESPKHPYTQALLESVPRASTEEQDREIEALSGDVPSPREPPSGCRFRTRCPKVIPPDGMDIEQESYREIMDLRQQIESRRFDIESIDGDAETDGVVETLKERTIQTDLPAAHESTVDDALEAVAGEEWERAEEILAQRYESVCETTAPPLVGGDHCGACHLLSDDEPVESGSDTSGVATDD
ncbi:ABC transporter ATP-binding protein [Halovenus sp. HT40]|uniref:ABC transporter ATP-binding protein n=1 Tax=Halovenus sp. HT40 TaxID=3126691 RepID=UPI00300EB072